MKNRWSGLTQLVFGVTVIILIVGGAYWASKVHRTMQMAYDKSHVPVRQIVLPRPNPLAGQVARAIAFAPNGESAVVIDGFGILRFWDGNALLPSTISVPQRDAANFVTWTPAGNTVLVAGNSDFHLMDVRSGAVQRVIPAVPTLMQRFYNPCECIASPDASLTACSEADGTLGIWDVHTGGKVFYRNRPPDTGTGRRTYVCGLAFSPDDHWLAVAKLAGVDDTSSGMPMSITLYDTYTGHLAKQWEWNQTGLETFHNVSNNLGGVGLAFSQDGHTLAGIGPLGGHIWDSSTGKAIVNLEPGKPSWFGNFHISFVPRKPLLVGIGWGDHINLWRTDTGHLSQTFYGTDYTSAMAISSDGRYLMTGGQNKNNTICLLQEWDLTYL